MKRSRISLSFVLVSLVSLGVITPARADIPEALAAFKAAANELKTCMVAITNEATAKANVVALEAAVTKLNQAGTTLDASLAALDRTTEANAAKYQSAQSERQTASQALVAEELRLLAARPICAVVCTKLSALRK